MFQNLRQLLHHKLVQRRSQLLREQNKIYSWETQIFEFQIINQYERKQQLALKDSSMLEEFYSSISLFLQMFFCKHYIIIMIASFMILVLIGVIIGFAEMILALQSMSKYTCKTEVKDFLIILSLSNLLFNILAIYLLFLFVRSKKKPDAPLCQIIVNFLFEKKVTYLYIILFIFEIIWIIQSDYELRKEPLNSTCRRPIFLTAYSLNLSLSIIVIMEHSGLIFWFLTSSIKNIDCRFWLKNLCFYISCSYYFKLDCKIEPPQSQYQIEQQIDQPVVNTNAVEDQALNQNNGQGR